MLQPSPAALHVHSLVRFYLQPPAGELEPNNILSLILNRIR
jgi:hypothetical protein